jgi:hypothetical protein
MQLHSYTRDSNACATNRGHEGERNADVTVSDRAEIISPLYHSI